MGKGWFPHCLPLTQAKYLTKKSQAASVEAVKMLDEILLQLCVSARSRVALAGELGTFGGGQPGSPAREVTLCQQPQGRGEAKTPSPAALRAARGRSGRGGSAEPGFMSLPQSLG